MKSLLACSSLTAIGLCVASGAFAQESNLSDRIAKLEAEIALLKRQHEVELEEAKASKEKSANVEIGKKGLSVTSQDKKYSVALHGYFQLNDRIFLDDEASSGRDEFLARRLRPYLDVQMGDVSFRFMPDFAGGTARIFDAYMDYKFSDAAVLRAGKFKPFLTLEQLQSDADNSFIERGHPSSLAPSRDLGIGLNGELFESMLEYQLALTNGNPDFSSADNDEDDMKDVVARVFARPFKNADTVAIRGIGFGVGGSYGDREGNSSKPILPDYRSPGQQAFFKYRSGALPADTTYADGEQWRFFPQAAWFWGNKSIIGEYGISSQEVTRGGSHATLEHHAWQVLVSYVLTGEEAAFKGGIKPAQDFSLKNGGLGAWELIARVGETEIDDDAFPVYADPTKSASDAMTFGAGINWYLTQNFELSLDYDFTSFDGGATGGDRDDEQALFSRAQFRF